MMEDSLTIHLFS